MWQNLTSSMKKYEVKIRHQGCLAVGFRSDQVISRHDEATRKGEAKKSFQRNMIITAPMDKMNEFKAFK